MTQPSGLPGLGPAAAAQLTDYLARSVGQIADWMAEYGDFRPHPSQDVGAQAFEAAHAELVRRLRDNYPFFHPRYIGQMLKPPHPAAVVAYLTTMLVNPNNHALDGGPATARMEREAVASLADMFGFETHLGHLTSSGTIANLEALFVAREIHPGRGIAYSADAHYTPSRMSHLLGMPAHPVPTDAAGRMDLDALAELLAGGHIGTVVLTAGTTGLGAIDRIDQAVPLCAEYGARIHVDAAYGGFFATIADDSPDGVAAAAFRAIGQCDSVVIDPHKHGLQPYGCGAVLFRDPGVQRHYRHDSPYTYFTSEEVHLGEISIECSRSGAAAAALWLTLRLLPLTDDGIGQVLRPGRRAALAFAELAEASDVLRVYQPPELDIVTYFPHADALAQIDALSGHVLDTGMAAPADEAIFVATYTVGAAALAQRGHRVQADVESGRILRSVFMKPETEAVVPQLVEGIETLISMAGTT